MVSLSSMGLSSAQPRTGQPLATVMVDLPMSFKTEQAENMEYMVPLLSEPTLVISQLLRFKEVRLLQSWNMLAIFNTFEVFQPSKPITLVRLPQKMNIEYILVTPAVFQLDTFTVLELSQE